MKERSKKQATETELHEETEEKKSEMNVAEKSNSADDEKNKKLNRIIKILIILLLLSLCALAVRCAYLAHRESVPATVLVPDNIVGDQEGSGSGTDTDSLKSQTDNSQNSITNTKPSGSGASGDFDVSKKDSHKDNSGDSDQNSTKPKDNTDDNPSGGNGEEPENPGSDNPGTDQPGDDNPGTDEPGTDTPGGGTSGGSSTAAPVLKFYKEKTEWNQPFQAENLFPGDHVKKYYCIEIYHDSPTTVYFKATITSKKAEKYLAMNPLQDNLMLKVTRYEQNPEADTGGQNAVQGEVLCDVPFSQADEKEYAATFAVSSDSPTLGYYCIEAYLDTSVGNECAAKILTADFQWYVKEGGSSGGGTVTPGKPDQPTEPDKPDQPENPEKPDKPTTPDKPDKPDKPTTPDKPSKPADSGKDKQDQNPGGDADSLIKPPKTGDAMNLSLWTVAAGSALLLLILMGKKRKEEQTEDGSNREG